MHFAGVLPEDAPDPRHQMAEQVAGLPFPVFGLRPQATIEDDGEVGLAEGRDSSGTSESTVSVGYTLWRNPDDRNDPINLADLDELTRAALDEVPPWPRPPWLVEQVERMRYPALWDAVNTTWTRQPSEFTTVPSRLAAHVNYILENQFRDELGLSRGWDVGADREVTESALTPAAVAMVDDRKLTGTELASHPLVYAVGFTVSPDVVVTAVLPREHLDYIDVAFVTR